VEPRFVLAGSTLNRAKSLGLQSCSADYVALVGMLVVVVPVTAGLFPDLSAAAVPSTLLVTASYWLFGTRLRDDRLLVFHAIGFGLLAGYANAVGTLHLHLWLSGKFEDLPLAGLASLLFGFIGCLHGVVYGLALLPPLWLARRSLRFHSAEAVDRVLLGVGAWGLATLGIAAGLVRHVAADLSFDDLTPSDTPPVTTALWTLATLACLLMLAFGVERLRQRRAWLARVRKGKVPGWVVVSSEQFGEQLDELPAFCPRLFGRGAASDRDVELVLAEGVARKGAYRSEGLTPRFRLV